jgi:hypothetical protein
MVRARGAASGTIVLTHERASNAERMAARRLVERGLLSAAHRYGNRRTLQIFEYRLTERGRSCWLRVKSDEGRS